MREYLERDGYCDWDHPEIRLVAERAREINSRDRETAVWLFEFVRDEVTYRFGPWSVPASQTLQDLGGMCTTKSNLLVALLRAADIPAAYGTLRVDGGEYFGSIVPSAVKMGNSDSVHVYAAVWLDNRWVRCDPSADRRISEKSAHFCATTTLIEWNGVSDRMDVLDPKHIHEDLGLSPDLKHLVHKEPRKWAAQRHAIFNYYLDFLRSQEPFDSADTAVVAMLEVARKDPAIWPSFEQFMPLLLETHSLHLDMSTSE